MSQRHGGSHKRHVPRQHSRGSRPHSRNGSSEPREEETPFHNPSQPHSNNKQNYFNGNDEKYHTCGGWFHIKSAGMASAFVGMFILAAEFLYIVYYFNIWGQSPAMRWISFGEVCMIIIFFHIPIFLGINEERPFYLCPAIVLYFLSLLSLVVLFIIIPYHYYIEGQIPKAFVKQSRTPSGRIVLEADNDSLGSMVGFLASLLTSFVLIAYIFHILCRCFNFITAKRDSITSMMDG